jgi:protein TorT
MVTEGYVGKKAEAQSDTEKWWPIETKVIYKEGGEIKKESYIPPEKAKKAYTIGVAGISVADYWQLTANYGIVQEAKRLGVKLRYATATWAESDKQLNQMEDFVQLGVDGMIIMPIRQESAGRKVDEIWQKNRIPIVTMGNTARADNLLSSVTAPYDEVGLKMGEYINEKGGGKVVFLPGPAGAQWAEDYVKGFKQYMKEHPENKIDLLAVMYGQADTATQLKLGEDALQTYPLIDYLIGTPQSCAALVPRLKERGRTEVKLLSTYVNLGIKPFVEKGEITATFADHPAVQPRISVAVLVEYLDGKPMTDIPKMIISPVDYIDTAIAKSDPNIWNKDLAPAGYKATFNID